MAISVASAQLPTVDNMSETQPAPADSPGSGATLFSSVASGHMKLKFSEEKNYLKLEIQPLSHFSRAPLCFG
jgi:hypothetical protein